MSRMNKLRTHAIVCWEMKSHFFCDSETRPITRSRVEILDVMYYICVARTSHTGWRDYMHVTFN